MYYVYLLKSQRNGHYYVGCTSDLKKRLHSHNEGMNRATKSYTPWELIYYEAYQTSQAAYSREKVLKHHGRTLSALKHRAETGQST